MFDNVKTKYRSWRQYRETYGELMRLSTRELNDIGVSRSDIPTIARSGKY